MNITEIKTFIETKLPGKPIRVVRDSLVIENPSDLLPVAGLLKDAPELRLDFLTSVTGSDFIDYLESVYHFCSIEKKTAPVTLRVRVKKDNPAIPSLVSLFRGAEYQEREAYDMYGIIYENHPDLRRIFMWEGFEGYPMRKDYVQEDSEYLDDEDAAWLGRHGIPVSENLKKKPDSPKPAGGQNADAD